ncbi:maleylpyruvate isomerase family mycothiol-dependent enzyme [Streptomyces sp. MST-110588]|uniref:maleylpyruvate isomerase family mycothiol-dependent enzyme n=1 Tax=Streptomyces sp. MST-110588 TaxID=2833628 RepID=UPI001F5C5599|nr:maleylpyruvate isomerase family mycothiol-dependent enzyme [Streptomyces sp. MST-110588]UNO42353.1 maleylpyruvate isomerase family mycothiol-dependent enzyme [Streptomyces sp. MST-110588]
MTFDGSLSHDRYCAEILAQTTAFRQTLRGADLTVTVPTCPDWTLARLARHVGGAHRWAGTIVATRAERNVPEADVPGLPGPEEDDPDALDMWLEEGARMCADALREAGPDTRVWCWAPGQPAGFWARRMTHETVVHRADAARAAGVEFRVEAEVAADTVEEWLQLVRMSQTTGHRPGLERLLEGGGTILLRATDTPPGLAATWLIDLNGEAVTYRRAAREDADAELRGPLADVLRVFYRRLPADSGRVAVRGDRALLDRWLELVSFE